MRNYARGKGKEFMQKTIRLRFKRAKVITQIIFVDADKINHSRLAEALTAMGVKASRPNVSQWIKNGSMPAKNIPYVKRIPFMDVLVNRGKKSKGGADR